MTEARQNLKCFMRLNSCKHNLLFILLVEFYRTTNRVKLSPMTVDGHFKVLIC